MPPQIKQAKLREESKEKFGQFYVSVDDKTNAIRIVDLEGGIAVNGEDGTKIRCVASTDIENFWLSKLSQAKLETLEAIIKEVEGMKDRRYYEDITHADEELKVIQARSMEIGHNRAFSDLLTKLQASLTLLKNEK